MAFLCVSETLELRSPAPELHRESGDEEVRNLGTDTFPVLHLRSCSGFVEVRTSDSD